MTVERRLPSDFDASTVAAIDDRLASVCRTHHVAIPLAIESGSRAWGFASPDSDYDCRFVFVRHADAYLTPWPPRDVIETPLDAVLDVNGWDVGKLISLIAKGNAVGIEWLRSPIVYRASPDFRSLLLAFATDHADRDAIRRHYHALAARQWSELLRDGDQVRLKKLFYVLRPIAAILWLDRNVDSTAPPMTLSGLIDGIALAVDVVAAIDDLRGAKASAPESWRGRVHPTLRRFIETHLDRDLPLTRTTSLPADGKRAAAEQLFRTIVHRFGPAAA